jgi:YVTN family beta-propeller protein
MKIGLLVKIIILILLASVISSLGCKKEEKESRVPEGTRTVYVVNEDDDTVSVMDGITKAVIASIPVGQWPHYIALDPAGKRAYVTNGESNNISVIDTATHRVVSTIEGIYSDPQEIAVHPAGRLAYVPCYDTAKLQVIDLTECRISASIRVGEGAHSIALSSDGSRVYVVSLRDPQAIVIDTTINKAVATFTVGEGACGIAVSRNGDRLYLGGHGVGMWKGKGEKNMDIRVIDAKTFKQMSLIRCGIMPIGVKLSYDGKQTYVVSHGSGELHMIDNVSHKTTSVRVGKDCRDLVGTMDGKWVYVTNRGDNTVSVVDVSAKEVVATVRVGKSPVGIALNESTRIRSR